LLSLFLIVAEASLKPVNLALSFECKNVRAYSVKKPSIMVICDPRLIDKPYGRVFRASLPPMPVTRVGADAEKFLRRIAGTAAESAGLTRIPEVGEMSDGIA
jgi:hypothetical protein